jgi:hypothetical protein
LQKIEFKSKNCHFKHQQLWSVETFFNIIRARDTGSIPPLAEPRFLNILSYRSFIYSSSTSSTCSRPRPAADRLTSSPGLPVPQFANCLPRLTALSFTPYAVLYITTVCSNGKKVRQLTIMRHGYVFFHLADSLSLLSPTAAPLTLPPILPCASTSVPAPPPSPLAGAPISLFGELLTLFR